MDQQLYFISEKLKLLNEGVDKSKFCFKKQDVNKIKPETI